MSKLEMEKEVSRLLLEQKKLARLNLQLPPNDLMLLKRLLYRLGLTRMSRTPRRYVRPDEMNHNGLIAAIKHEPDAALPRLAFADFLQENGIPGAHVVREHAQGMHEGTRTRSMPSDSGHRVSRIMVLGKRRRYGGEGLTSYQDRLTGEIRELPIAQLGYRPGSIRLSVSHVANPEETVTHHSGGTRVTHGVQVRDLDHLRHLTQDWPQWARQEVERLATPNFTETPQQMSRSTRPLPLKKIVGVRKYANRPEPIRGLLTPEQLSIAKAAMEKGSLAGWGILGDALQEAGHLYPGMVLSKVGTGHPNSTDKMYSTSITVPEGGFEYSNHLDSMTGYPKGGRAVSHILTINVPGVGSKTFRYRHPVSEKFSRIPPKRYGTEPTPNDRVAENWRMYAQSIRPRLHPSKFNTPEEHALFHKFVAQRGLKLKKSPVSYYDSGSHTLYHPEPDNPSSVAKEYLRWAGRPVKMRRKGLPIKMAKVDGHEPAHPAVAGFPIEHALRHLANDPKNTPHVRDLASHVLKTGDSSGLWGLHDALRESDHPMATTYNWMSAGDKLQLDKHTKTALNDIAAESRVGVPEEHHHTWWYRPEHVAERAERAMRKGDARSDHFLRRDRQLLNRVRQLAMHHSGVTDPKLIDESIRRHANRAWYEWNRTTGNEHGVVRHQDDALKPLSEVSTNDPDHEKTVKATRYSRFKVGKGEPLMGGTDFMHEVHDEAGNRVGHVWVTPMENGTHLHVNHVGMMGHDPNATGIAAIRDVRRQLKAMYPAAQTISGSSHANTGQPRSVRTKLARVLPVKRYTIEPLKSGPRSYWLSPAGEVHDLGSWGNHEKWMRQRGLDAGQQLESGWHAVVVEHGGNGGTMYSTGHKPVTSAQREALYNLSRSHGVGQVYQDVKGQNRPLPVKFKKGGTFTKGTSSYTREDSSWKLRTGSIRTVPSTSLAAASSHGIPGGYTVPLAYPSMPLKTPDGTVSSPLPRSYSPTGESPSRRSRRRPSPYSPVNSATSSSVLGSAPWRYSIDLGATIRSGMEASAQQRRNNEYVQDHAAGKVLADALDEAGRPHAPFFRALSHKGTGFRHESEKGVVPPRFDFAATSPYGRYLTEDTAHWIFRPGTSDKGEPLTVVHRTQGRLSHTALMNADELREWANHDSTPPDFRGRLIRLAEDTEGRGVKKMQRPRRYSGALIPVGDRTPVPQYVNQDGSGKTMLDALDDIHHWHARMILVYQQLAQEARERGDSYAARVANEYEDDHRLLKAKTREVLKNSGRAWPNWTLEYGDHTPVPYDQDFELGEKNIGAKTKRRPKPTVEVQQPKKLLTRTGKSVKYAVSRRGDFIDSLRLIKSSNQKAMHPAAQTISGTRISGSSHANTGQPRSVRTKLTKRLPVKRYMLAPRVNEFGPSMQAEIAQLRQENEGYTHPEEFLRMASHDVLADHLQEHDDPREAIVRRRLPQHKANTALQMVEGRLHQLRFPDGTHMQVGNMRNGHHYVEWGGDLGPPHEGIPWYSTTMTHPEYEQFMGKFSEHTRPTEIHPHDPTHLSRKPRRYAVSRRGSFIDSLRLIKSSNQRAMHQVAEQVSRQLGLEPTKVYDALHDTPHGAVPGIAQAVYGQASPEALHAAAAWIGLTSNAPGVAVFHPRPTGPDFLHRVRMDGSGMDARVKLDRFGLRNRIIIPHKKGMDILIPDPKGSLTNSMERFANHHHLTLETSPGHFKTIGAADQAQARAVFRDKVATQEQGA